MSGAQVEVKNLVTPVAGTDAANKDYVDGTFVAKTGDTMTGHLRLTNNAAVEIISSAGDCGVRMSGEGEYAIMRRMPTPEDGIRAADHIAVWANATTPGKLYFRRARADQTTTYDDYQVYHQGFKPTAAEVGALSATGGSIPGEILFTGNGLSSGLRFLPTGSNDAFGIRCVNPDTNTGELEFYSTDDDVEPFVFRHYTAGNNGSGTSAEWVRIDNEGLKVKGNLVYHPGNKPTPADIGAL